MPVELLAARRSAVFTHPNETRNKHLRVTPSGSHEMSDALSPQITACYSDLPQRTANGNASDAQACGGDPTPLCNGDNAALTTQGGRRIGNSVNPGFSLHDSYSEINCTPTPAGLSCASPAGPCSLANFFVAAPSLRLLGAHTSEAGPHGRSTVEGVLVSWDAGLFRTGADIPVTGSTVQGRSDQALPGVSAVSTRCGRRSSV